MMRKLLAVLQMFNFYLGLLLVLMILLCFISPVNATTDFQDNFERFASGDGLTSGIPGEVGSWAVVDPGAFTYVTEAYGHSKLLAIGRQGTSQSLMTSGFSSLSTTCSKKLILEYDFYNNSTQYFSYFAIPVIFGQVGSGDTFGLSWTAADGAGATYQYYTGDIAVKTSSSVPVVLNEWVHVTMTLTFDASGVQGTQDILLTRADNTSVYVCQNIPITLPYPDGDLPKLFVLVGAASAPSYNAICLDNVVADVSAVVNENPVSDTVVFKDAFERFTWGDALTTGTAAEVGSWAGVDPGAFTYVTQAYGHSKLLAIGRQETAQALITSTFSTLSPTCNKRLILEYDFYNNSSQYFSYFALPVIFGQIGSGDTFGLFWNAADGAGATYQYYDGYIASRIPSSVPVVLNQWVHVTMTLTFDKSGVQGMQDIQLFFEDNTSAYVCKDFPITLPYPDGDLPKLFVLLGSTSTGYNAICLDNIVVDVIDYLPTKAPLFSPALPYLSGPTKVTITSDTVGAAIYYTLNGGIPTRDSMRYAGPVTVNDRDVLQAIAVADGYRPSAVTSQTYEYNPAGVELTRGHNLLIERGLQIQALIFPVKEDQQNTTGFNVTRFLSANFTGADLWSNPVGTPYLGEAPGIPWGRLTSTGIVYEAELPYVSNLVNLQFQDEQDILDPQNLSEIAAGISYAKKYYPYTLVYTNQWGTQHTFAEMQAYMAAAQPDLVKFDTYAFNGTLTGGSPTALYESMQKYRLLGLAGNDGTGVKPIPYALFTQTFTYPTLNNHIVSESEIRLNNFAAWVFGYKFVTAFTYDSFDSYLTNTPIMFNGIGDDSPTSKFDEVAETNRQSKNLGATLVRLLSTDLRIIMGLHDSGTANTAPSGVTTGLTGADAWLTDVTAMNLGSTNNGLPGDVIIGFFKPLHETFDGNAYSNQRYFMVTNGLSDAMGSASATAQKIRLTFTMGASGITSLQRLSRNTGTIEIVPLVSDGGGIYHLDLVLDGGTGDLFKYNTGAPFVGIEAPVDRIPGDANNDRCVDVGDLGILAANYGMTSGATWNKGDFNGDGAVDVGDLGILAANYGTNAGSLDWTSDYAKVFPTTLTEDAAKETSSSMCSALGLPLIAGLLMISLMLVKMEE